LGLRRLRCAPTRHDCCYAARLRPENGQALVLMTFALVVLIGFAGVVIDIGRLYVAQRQLQQAVDAAALAAGQNLPHVNSAYVSAVDYSAVAGEYNAHPLSMSANAPTVTFKCLSSLAPGVPCSTDLDQTQCHPAGSAPPLNGNGTQDTTGLCNAVQVTETASVPTTLLHLFLPSRVTTVAASSVAAARGGVRHPADIMVVLDTTASMAAACGDPVLNEDGTQAMSAGQSEKIDCAKDGVRRLLEGLLPCQQGVLGNCGAAAPLDEVGLEVFPGLESPNGFSHSTDTNVNHTDLALELNENGTQCAGNLTARPAWYTPSASFPGWFFNGSEVGYPSDEVQTVTISHATGGTFTLSYGGQTTNPALAYNATAATVQAALDSLTTIGSVRGNVFVAGGAGGPFTVTFSGGLAGQPLALMTANASNLNGSGHTVTVAETTKGNGKDTYLVTGRLSNDFKLSNASTTLNPASQIARAVTWDACTGGAVPTHNGAPDSDYGVNSAGGAGTYYAGAISAAQAVLAADSSRQAQPVIILLSDGDANTAPDGPSPCHQGIQAAQAAANEGTWVYSIAYDSSTTSGCALDTTPPISPFVAMQQIARNSTNPNLPDPSKFYCVPAAQCPAGNTSNTLAQVFASIGMDLTDSRLVPMGTQ